MLLLCRPLQALPACSAEDITTSDPSCPPGDGPCTLSLDHDVGAGCTLDFGTRPLTIAARLHSGPAIIRVLAGSIILTATGVLDGRGEGSFDESGGTIRLTSAGSCETARSSRVDVSGNGGGGTVQLECMGKVEIAGGWFASGLTDAAAGGSIGISTSGDARIAKEATVELRGGDRSTGGGTLDIEAGGLISAETDIDARGSTGGTIALRAAGSMRLRGLDVSGIGQLDTFNFDGGQVILDAAGSIDLDGGILASGRSGTVLSGGGFGGTVDIESGWDSIRIHAPILAEGGQPDADGGFIDLRGHGEVLVAAGAELSVASNGVEGAGGSLSVVSDGSIEIAGGIDAGGGGSGGDIRIVAAADITADGPLTSRGRSGGSSGGDIALIGGDATVGDVTVRHRIDVGAGACSGVAGCSTAGTIELVACDVTVTTEGSLLANALTGGGRHRLSARENLVVAGTIEAGRNNPLIELRYPQDRSPVLDGATLTPAPTLIALATCSESGQLDCLDPCPDCGNSRLEYPEECDRGVGAEGCCDLRFCRISNCDDHRACSLDRCDENTGCVHEPLAPPCLEPSVTVSPTATPTATEAATSTREATASATPEPSTTPAPIPTATSTATADCVGDCDGDGRVTVEELVTVHRPRDPLVHRLRCRRPDRGSAGDGR